MPAATPCLWKNRYISKSNGSCPGVPPWAVGREETDGADRPALVDGCPRNKDSGRPVT